MPVTGPDFISLQVRDLERAATFYADTVGIPRAAVSPPHAVAEMIASIGVKPRRSTKCSTAAPSTCRARWRTIRTSSTRTTMTMNAGRIATTTITIITTATIITITTMLPTSMT